MSKDSKFFRLCKIMDLQVEIRRLDETSRLLKEIEAKYTKKSGKKRLMSSLSKTQEHIEDLKESLQQTFEKGLENIKSEE